MIFAPGLLAGQAAIVTGGGTGIGRGIALELARAGANVALAGRRPEPLKETAAEAEKLGVQALTFPLDVRDWDQVNAMVTGVQDCFGSVDIVVNNAGGQFGAPFETLSPNGWRSVIDVNLGGVFNCTRAAAPTMIRQRHGKVLNIIAGFTRRAAPNLAHSGAARAGVENLTRSLAVEWAQHNIQVNCISPVVWTDALARNYAGREGAEEDFLGSIPARRCASAQEVGWLAVFLASPAGDYITGEHIVMDGAYWLATALHYGSTATEGK